MRCTKYCTFLYREYRDQATADGLPPKQLLSVSGDDDGKHYILYPTNIDTRGDFTYDLYLLIDSGSDTVGTQAVVDLDGDGYVEIVSAAYSQGRVYVHTFG